MDIVIICNGLGNQMSQYAFFLKKKSINKKTRFIYDRRSSSQHNGFELERVFGIPSGNMFVNRLLWLVFRILSIERFPHFSRPVLKFFNFFNIKLIKESPNYDYDENLMTPSKGLRFYYGGWHSEKYFKSNREEILKAFCFEYSDDISNIEAFTKIKETNSVSIHVRRGDYMNETNFNVFGAVCTKDYFKKAISEISSCVEDPHFYIFSNDIPWVKDNLMMDNMSIIDCNKGKDSWKDMYLISNCKYNINSNSSFSWWAAWLNVNENNIVIVPKFFINNVETKDVYPKRWRILTNYS
ncbi:alpha-1,2-fucosyltransferase [Pedobacter nutrimenti]|uniref:Glycosyl transferase family 11 n=1 Tax=Pedobacter nutrimenti TaxID=1241337 RepID=A0A318UV13_9SPHI|nr:alpha-1,2-fucosyltransferase [Pedobacter nutrimenti]PYF75459.1 glycosyl transferase family 11 [Pedobacter nutrimenti]